MSILPSLTQILGSDKVLTGADLQERYEHIWRMDIPLTAKAVLLPSSTEEVSEIMKICSAANQPVVIHGGLTNLVGGTVTTSEEIVISTEKLNQIEEIDEKSRTITVQAGVILEQIHQAVEEKDFLFPLSFGAKGTAQIGGVISSNAGGLRVFRFGMTRNLVLGLEAVLADGTIISSMKKIIKDNSGYDLKQLFIGSEGTLGVVTKAVLKLVEAPTSRNSAFIGVNRYEDVVKLLRFMDAGLAGTLSSFELIWGNTYEALTGKYASVPPPLAYGYSYYVLLDALGSHQEADAERLMNLVEQALERGFIEDAVFASTAADLKWFWTVREDVHSLVAPMTFDHHFDISIPIALIGEMVDAMIEELTQISEVEFIFPFGHIADGNVHFIIGKANTSKELKKQIDHAVYSPLKAINGSVSAEHGIGLDKKMYLDISRSPEEIALMQMIKKSMDPKGILNPGRIL